MSTSGATTTYLSGTFDVIIFHFFNQVKYSRSENDTTGRIDYIVMWMIIYVVPKTWVQLKIKNTTITIHK